MKKLLIASAIFFSLSSCSDYDSEWCPYDCEYRSYKNGVQYYWGSRTTEWLACEYDCCPGSQEVVFNHSVSIYGSGNRYESGKYCRKKR